MTTFFLMFNNWAILSPSHTLCVLKIERLMMKILPEPAGAHPAFTDWISYGG